MPDTLLGVAQEELAKAEAEQARARDEIAAAQGDLDQAEKDAAAASKALAEALDAAAKIRQQIAATTNAADGQALFGDLDEKRTAARASQAALNDAEERADGARARIAALQEELDRAGGAAGAAGAAIPALDARGQATTAWSAAAKGAPLKNLPGSADVTKPGDAKDAADAAAARLDGAGGGDVPKELFALAHARRGRRAARLTALAAAATAGEDRLADEQSNAGLAGAAVKSGVAYERSVEVVRSFALTAQNDYDRALRLLADVAASTPLNADEAARVEELRQAAIAKNSFALQEDYEAKQAAADAAADDVQAARLDALATDPTADPDAAQDVKDKQALVKPLQDKADTAKGKLTQDVTDALDAVEAAVPDETWRLFDAYEEALEVLAALAAIDPAQIASDLSKAEDAYAKALRKDHANARTVAAVTGYAREWDDRAKTSSQQAPTRLLEALRGDA